MQTNSRSLFVFTLGIVIANLVKERADLVGLTAGKVAKSLKLKAAAP